ncbi:MAG: sulfite exporter TauE/SafE family protein [Nocardioidaceae bacterium]|nr:sulfite exporter TauE/SafE family protein [Nocardioidaceae bacterium]
MTGADLALLVVAGFLGGLTGTIAGLASLFTYPALLATGLAPVAANVTNTVAMVSTAVGSAATSRPELRGQGRRVVVATCFAAVGGLGGAALLLSTPASVFELVVPFLVAFGSVLLLARDPLRRWADARAARRPPGAVVRASGVLGPGGAVSIVAIGVYGGYFGAGAGIMALAVLSLLATERLAVTNAVKNLVTGGANLAGAVVYALVADVDWLAVVVLASGLVAGSACGPLVVRRVPQGLLRMVIAVAGIGLAVRLFLSAIA